MSWSHAQQRMEPHEETTGREDALLPEDNIVARSTDGSRVLDGRPDQAAGVARWTFMRLNAVAARCSSLVALSRPRREKQSMIFFRLPIPVPLSLRDAYRDLGLRGCGVDGR